jgi:hypothetical protein
VLIGYDDDLAAEPTRISNRIRGRLAGIHPTLERGRAELTRPRRQTGTWMRKKLVEDIIAAFDE